MQDHQWSRHRTGSAAGGGYVAVWGGGLLCGTAVTAAADALRLSFVYSLALAGGLPLAAVALQRLLRPRRRAVVWEEMSWRSR